MNRTERRVVRELRKAGFKVLTRKQWGSKHLGLYQWRRVNRRFVGPADHHFAHITVTHAGSDPRQAAQDIERIGMDRFGTGWSYNWGLHKQSRTILLGQPHDAAGAHTLNDKNVPGFHDNLNYWGHAIAFLGMPDDEFDGWCERATAAIIAAEKKHGAARNRAQLYPHSKFAAKDCPCNDYRNAIPVIERRSRTILDTDPDRQERRTRRAERKAQRKRERRQERREAKRQRRRELATGKGVGRVREAKADLRLAFNQSRRKGWEQRGGRLRKAIHRLATILKGKS